MHSEYLTRILEQLAGVLTRALELADQGKLDEASRLVEQAYTSVVGFPRAQLERLDAGSARMMLGPRSDMAARLLDCEAEIARVAGDTARETERRKRAAAIRGE